MRGFIRPPPLCDEMQTGATNGAFHALRADNTDTVTQPTTYIFRPMKLHTIATALLACTAPLLCQAGRPLQTEDAGILEAKTCEVERVKGRERTTGAPSKRETALQLGYGVGANSQLALAVSTTSDGTNCERACA